MYKYILLIALSFVLVPFHAHAEQQSAGPMSTAEEDSPVPAECGCGVGVGTSGTVTKACPSHCGSGICSKKTSSGFLKLYYCGDGLGSTESGPIYQGELTDRQMQRIISNQHRIKTKEDVLKIIE